MLCEVLAQVSILQNSTTRSSPGSAKLLGFKLNDMCMPSTATLCTSSCLTHLMNSLNGTLMTSVSPSPRPMRPPTGHMRMRKNSMSKLSSNRTGCCGFKLLPKRCSHANGFQLLLLGRLLGSSLPLPLLVLVLLLLAGLLLLLLLLLSLLAQVVTVFRQRSGWQGRNGSSCCKCCCC
jgi:hypothetical protein